MSVSETLTGQKVRDVLERAVAQACPGTMSHLAKGKWYTSSILHTAANRDAVHVELVVDNESRPVAIQINQPVGIAVQDEFSKFIYEASVIGFESSVNQTGIGKIVLEAPDNIERIQRRGFIRIPVPQDIMVKVLFWHRGYSDGASEVPDENYWQGRLVNLSASGFQIAVDLAEGSNFRVGQLVGLQFTPLSYEKPIVAEAQVKHVAENAEDGHFYIGAEFIGLEASSLGRKKMRRILEVVSAYQERNNTLSQAKAVTADSTG